MQWEDCVGREKRDGGEGCIMTTRGVEVSLRPGLSLHLICMAIIHSVKCLSDLYIACTFYATVLHWKEATYGLGTFDQPQIVLSDISEFAWS